MTSNLDSISVQIPASQAAGLQVGGTFVEGGQIDTITSISPVQPDGDVTLQLTTPTSSATPLLADPPISLLAFASEIGSAINSSEQSLYTSQQQSLVLNNPYWESQIAEAIALGKASAELTQEIASESTLYTTQESQLAPYNSLLSSYNSELALAQGLQNQLNGYYASFQAGNITQTQYNADVAADSASVTNTQNNLNLDLQALNTAANTLNAQIANNNTTIAQLNATRAILGIPDQIPLQTPVAPPSSAPILDGTGASPPPSSAFAALPQATASIDVSLDIAPISPAESTFFTQVASDYDAIDNGSSALDYNALLSAVQGDYKAINQAITTYQNSNFDQSAVTAYNNAIARAEASINGINALLGSNSSPIPGYIASINNFNNNLLPGINSQINTFNQARLAQNPPVTPLIPLQTAIPVPTQSSLLISAPTPPTATVGQPLPASAANFPTTVPYLIPITPVGSTTSQNPDFFFSAFVTPAIEAEFSDFKTLAAALNFLQTQRVFLAFVLQPRKNPTLKGFIENAPPVATPVSGSGQGPSLLSLSVGLSNNSMQSIYTAGVIAGMRTFLNTRISQAAANAIQNFGLNLLTNAAAFSTLPALQQLGGNPDILTSGGPGVAAVLSLAYLNQIIQLSASDILPSGVNSILASSGLTPAQIAQVEGGVTAGLQLGILQTALLQTSTALGIPELIPQVLGNLNNNPTNANALQPGASQTTSSQLVANTVNQAFITAGLNSSTAASAANTAAETSSTELASNNLSASLNYQQILSAATSLGYQNAAQLAYTSQQNNFSASSYQTELVNQLVSQGLTQQAALSAANQVYADAQLQITHSQITQSIAEHALNQSLISQGIDQETAANAAAAAVAGVPTHAYTSQLIFQENLQSQLQTLGFGPTISSSAALAATGSVRLTGAALTENLTAGIASSLQPSLGAQQALNVANGIATAIYGTPTSGQAATEEVQNVNSASSRLQSAVAALYSTFNANAAQVVDDSFRDFLKPSTDLSTFASRLRDPANTFLITAGTGLMYARQSSGPANKTGLASVDILV